MKEAVLEVMEKNIIKISGLQILEISFNYMGQYIM